MSNSENMPENYEARFSSGEWNAKTVAALATGPGDIHWASFHNGNCSSLLCSKVDYKADADLIVGAAHTPVTMHPYLEKELLVYGPNSTTSLGRGTLKFVSFPPNGKGWFARYSNNVCLWGPSEAEMTPTFRALVANLEAGHPRKDECIDFVSFGAHDTLAVRYENGKSFFYVADDPSEAAKVSQQLLGDINGRLEDGWTFGNRTTLCGWDTNRWFIEWKKGNQAEFCYSMGVGEKEDLEKVSEVLNAPSGAGNVNNNLAGLVSDFERDLKIVLTNVDCCPI